MTQHNDALEAALPRIPAAAPATLWRWVPIRSLGPRHRARITEHLLALSDEDRTLRFGHLASDGRIRHYAELLDFERDQFFGIFDRRLRLAAMAHLAFDGAGEPGAAMAEFGVSVLARKRSRGLGSRLFEHAVMHARNRGVRTMLIHLARDNAAMLGIVRRAGAAVEFDGSDVLAQLPLPGHTLGSQIAELLGHQAAELDYRLKAHVLLLDAFRPDRT